MPSSQVKSTPFITNLPPEIRCQIFESAPDFSAVHALARTARLLHSTYLAGFPSIFHAVAARIHPEFSSAEHLVDVQEAAHSASRSLFEEQQHPPSRNERLVSNARCAAAASKSFASQCRVNICTRAWCVEEFIFKPSERARFKKSLYRLWTLCTLVNTPSIRSQAQQYLDERNPVELAGINEMAFWATECKENTFGDSGLNFQDGTWDAGCKLVEEYCGNWERRVKNGFDGILLYEDETADGYFVFFDHTQKYLQHMEGHW